LRFILILRSIGIEVAASDTEAISDVTILIFQIDTSVALRTGVRGLQAGLKAEVSQGLILLILK